MLLVALVPASTKTAVVHGGTSENVEGRHPRLAHQRRIATMSCEGETGMRGPEVAAPRDETFTSRDRPPRAVWCAGIPTRLIDAGAETDLARDEASSLKQTKHSPLGSKGILIGTLQVYLVKVGFSWPFPVAGTMVPKSPYPKMQTRATRAIMTYRTPQLS